MTLTELLVSVAMLGLIMTVLAGAISVVFRSEDGIERAVGESHDVQQAVNYFHLDIESGPVAASAYEWTSGSRGTGCADTGDANVLRYDHDGRRVAYLVTTTGTTATLDRYECEWNGSGYDPIEVLNIADTLDAASGAPVTVAVNDTDGDDEVDSIDLSLAQSATPKTVTAAPRAEAGIAPAASGNCGDDPIAPALDFAGFVDGDVTLLGQNVLGTLAVGGTLRWSPALGIAQNDKNSNYHQLSLYANAIDWTYAGTGTLNVNGGDIALNGQYHVFTTGSKKGRVYRTSAGTGKYIDAKKSVYDIDTYSDAIDFDTAFDDLQACSNLLAELPGSCSAADCAYHVDPLDQNCSGAYTGSGKMCLDLGPKGAQILNIPESELAQVTEFSHRGGLSQAHPLVINVIDDDGDHHVDFTLTTSSWQNIGNTKNVLINFPTATTVTIDQQLFGTVLAPYAHVSTTGNVTGGIIAASWTHNSGTVDNAGDNVFNGTIDWS